MKYLLYFGTVLKHKWFVLYAGTFFVGKIGFWKLLKHDLSKLSFHEFTQYANYFDSRTKCAPGVKEAFKKAWKHHYENNEHHWEHWLDEIGSPRPMPLHEVREMVADWLAASRSYEGFWPNDPEDWSWCKEVYPNIQLHPATRFHTDRMLFEYFNFKKVR